MDALVPAPFRVHPCPMGVHPAPSRAALLTLGSGWDDGPGGVRVVPVWVWPSHPEEEDIPCGGGPGSLPESCLLPRGPGLSCLGGCTLL